MTSENQVWFDKDRNREIPLKIYLPDEDNLSADPEFISGSHQGIPKQVRDLQGSEPPVVIFSHGLGGSLESYKYIGEFLARHGFVSIHPTHLGIDASLMKGPRPFQRLKEAADDRENLQLTPQDISFILDYIELNDLPYDLNKVAVAGHSFGSYTTLALSGQKLSRDGFEINLKDNRLKCAIAISPLANRSKVATAYEDVTIPVLHITGKKDDSPFGLLDPIERRVPYDNMHKSDQYLVIFEHADHMIFAAQRRQNKFSENDITVMELTCAVMLEFLNKYLLETNSSLDLPEFSAKLTAHAVFEKKLK